LRNGEWRELACEFTICDEREEVICEARGYKGVVSFGKNWLRIPKNDAGHKIFAADFERRRKVVRSPRRPGLVLLFTWGLMGSMLACCLLWVLMSIGGGLVDTAFEWSRSMLARLGISWSRGLEIVLLHLQVATAGFIIGSGFRFLGFRKQFGYDDNDA
jgi:hypothetical protein